MPRLSLALLAALATAWAALAPAPAAADIETYAIVQDDASLLMRGRTIRLWGIHIPQSGGVCRTGIHPVRCAPEAALALEFRIQSFVRCAPVSRNRDRSLNAQCFVQGAGSILEPDEDLAAYLLRQGLALALPGAPFEYVAWERIAQSQGRGLWSEHLRQVR